ncbi:hypothetical protein [Marinicella sp. W31]|uniref:hypothetical protein n=1 Tax=Marinicella sp. W31 TaxID=3023713 RepID=UPI0037573C77
MYKFIISAVLMITSAIPATAHESAINDPNWCDGHVQLFDHQILTGEQLKSLELSTCVSSGTESCGKFDHLDLDEEYGQAFAKALDICLSEENTYVEPIFIGPNSFFESGHHNTYNQSDGLEFVCGRCVSDELTNLTDLPN